MSSSTTGSTGPRSKIVLPSGYYTPPQVATIVGLRKNTVYRHIREGALRATPHPTATLHGKPRLMIERKEVARYEDWLTSPDPRPQPQPAKVLRLRPWRQRLLAAVLLFVLAARGAVGVLRTGELRHGAR